MKHRHLAVAAALVTALAVGPAAVLTAHAQSGSRSGPPTLHPPVIHPPVIHPPVVRRPQVTPPRNTPPRNTPPRNTPPRPWSAVRATRS